MVSDTILPETASIAINLIPRGAIEGYCKQINISVYDLLHELVQKGFANFVSYLTQNGIKTNIEPTQKAILHGSHKQIANFVPRPSTGGTNPDKDQPLIYATDDPDYAIFMAITKSHGGSYGIDYFMNDKGIYKIVCSVGLDFVNGESQLTDGYVYLLDHDKFMENGGHQYTSGVEQASLMAIPVNPQDMNTSIHIQVK